MAVSAAGTSSGHSESPVEGPRQAPGATSGICHRGRALGSPPRSQRVRSKELEAGPSCQVQDVLTEREAYRRPGRPQTLRFHGWGGRGGGGCSPARDPWPSALVLLTLSRPRLFTCPSLERGPQEVVCTPPGPRRPSVTRGRGDGGLKPASRRVREWGEGHPAIYK